MVLFLTILEVIIFRILYVLQKFRAGWKIEIYRRTYRDGSSELLTVKSRLQRLFRSIRYARGTEGMPVPKCGNCGHVEADHEVCCPEDISSLTPEQIIALLKEEGKLDDKAGTVREELAKEKDLGVGETTGAPGEEDSRDAGS